MFSENDYDLYYVAAIAFVAISVLLFFLLRKHRQVKDLCTPVEDNPPVRYLQVDEDETGFWMVKYSEKPTHADAV